MHLLFLLARIYPYIALAMLLPLAQLAIFFRRRKSPALYSVMGISGMLGIGIILWFVFRGDLHSDEWVRRLLGRE